MRRQRGFKEDWGKKGLSGLISDLIIQNAEAQAPFSLFKLNILDLQLPHGQRSSDGLLSHMVLSYCGCSRRWILSNRRVDELCLFLQRKKKPLSPHKKTTLLHVQPKLYRLLHSNCFPGVRLWQEGKRRK